MTLPAPLISSRNLLPFSCGRTCPAITCASLSIAKVITRPLKFALRTPSIKKPSSAFTTATLNPSRISSFASRTASRLPSLPICASPMFVITPWLGSAISHNLRISPAAFIPISSTISSSSVSTFTRLRGSPMWLLRLPAFLSVLYLVERTRYNISFVVVFPLLPVTATTGILRFILMKCARSCKDRSVSFTQIMTLPSSKPPGLLCTTAPLPFASAASR